MEWPYLLKDNASAYHIHFINFTFFRFFSIDEFAKWLDRILDENMPLPGVAINFNIYEEVDLHWSIQLISSTYFDEEDEDWNCYEEFTTGEDLYEWQLGEDT